MAARVLLQRRAVTPLTGALLAGGVALYPRVAHAEGPEGQPSKKPIYDDIDFPSTTTSSTATLVPNTATPSTSSNNDNNNYYYYSSPSPPPPKEATASGNSTLTRHRSPTPTDRLAVQIGRARLWLYHGAAAAEDAVNGAMDRAFDLEQSFTATVASLAPPRDSGERLVPGLIYVLVAGMAGSIVARRRGFVVRAAAPAALGLAAAWAVVPLTMRNCADLAWRYERRFPALADAHLRAREEVERGLRFAQVHTRLGVQLVDDKVSGAREAVEGWVKKGK